MQKQIVGALIVASLVVGLPCFADSQVEKAPQKWQVDSLKGLKSLTYGVVFDPDKKLAPTVAAALKDLTIGAKEVTVKMEDKRSVGADEGRLFVFVEHRENGNDWVGLAVQQEVKLERNPEISFAADTYRNGALVPKADVNKQLKKLCEQFVADFKKASGK